MSAALCGVLAIPEPVKAVTLAATDAPTQAAAPATKPSSDINILGPKPGYSPQIGTLVSMLTWMRPAVIRATKGLSQADLDFLLDKNSNTIGALMLHLAAAETYYQIHTFKGTPYGTVPDAVSKRFKSALMLGDAGRKEIKGHDLNYYLDVLTEVREKSLAEFKKRDDAWLISAVDPDFFDGPTDNYCKWFHVCEHESHHTGQIAILKKYLPGAKPTSD